MIYHIVSRSDWENAGTEPYRAPSLDSEGFIHCSYEHQVAAVANQFYRDQTDLVLMCIEPDRLTSRALAEDPGCGELFPHVYGPINREAVVAVRALNRDGEGRWVFPQT